MSEIKVNKISPRSGTTVTLGDSGDTFTIPSGATINNQGTATNFGATGAASWTTTVKTNSDSGFTATAGEGYFLNTTAGTISVNLPAGSAGAVVAFKDYAGTWDTNAVTLVQNGSDKIGGSAINATLDTEGAAVTLVFIDSTQGWLVTDDGLQSSAATERYITATGGSVTTVCTNFKVHTFTGPGTFCVSCAGNSGGSNTVSYMVVAGGGGAAGIVEAVGGGGAGGFREGRTTTCSYTVSPLNAPAGLPVTATSYPVVVGAGGAGGTGCSSGVTNPGGAASSFSTISSAGGGGGGGFKANGGAGGSGGGAGGRQDFAGGAGNTPPVSPPQGNAGGNSNAPNNGPEDSSGAGGGATAAGTAGTTPIAGTGGAGATTSINGTPTAFAGGGGGGSQNGTKGPGGVGGGGNGGQPGVTSEAGTANTGGGAGGGSTPQEPEGGAGKNGGSGIVIIRYKFQG